ncbi:family 43 glycosylhydrolase [Nibricoccus aquaticus]|nr:family 43 glycosylhydrolase [Nibricoccus aquaticus]
MTAMILKLVALGVAGVLAGRAWAGEARVLGWGDQGDGTYRNPVLKADYSDPDVIRVGEDFYLVASEFHFVGMQVLHSRDLVNWRVIGQVFDRLPIDAKYDEMRAYAQGTWAPSLRYRDGVFYVYVCTPQDGLFMWHTKDPAGPWSEMVTVKRVSGWEDPCPFWDDDGQAYLVRGKVGAGPIILHKLSADGTQLLDDGVEIYRGPVAEGPKLFKRGGFYFISLPEGGVTEGGQTVLRAKSIYGPYERREVLPGGSPHQGGIVELESGESWFLAFKSTGYLGRIGHLLPVAWGEDGWPVFGDRGRTVERWTKPKVAADSKVGAAGSGVMKPEVSEEFGAETLGPVWQWNHNPTSGAASLTERSGWLRLRGEAAAELRVAKNTLTQKLWDEAGVVDVKIDASGLSEGQRAGFTFVCGNVFYWVGATRREGVLRVRYEGEVGPALKGEALWLRGIYDGERARLLYSLDGASYVDTGIAVQLRAGQWKGARVGLFCYGEGGGSVAVDYFRYRYAGALAEVAVDREVEVAAGVQGLWCEPVGVWDGRTVLLYHSFADDRDGPGDLLKRVAQELSAKGVASLRVNFRGEGDKARTRIESTLTTRIADAEAAWRFAATQRGVDVSRIGALGWSLGATTAIETAGRNPAWFRSVAVWSSPSGDQEREMLSRAVAKRALRDGEATQHDPAWKSVTTTRVFYESFRGVNLDVSLRKYPGAFFSVRGSADHLAQYEMQFMKNRAGVKAPAESLLIAGANHVFDVFAPEKGHAERAVEATVGWFLRTL